MNPALVKDAQTQARELIKTLRAMTKDKSYQEFPICLETYIVDIGSLIMELKENS